MRNLPLCLAAALLTFAGACKKSSSSHPTNSNSTAWLSSVTNWAPQTSVVDSFVYDSGHRVAAFLQAEFDTSTGSPLFGAWSAVFALPAAAGAPPTSYTTDLSGIQELHQLTFDGQGRIVKDSSTGPSGWVNYFGYPNGNIAITALYNGTVSNSIVDTLFLSAGNMSSFHIYGPNNAGTADSLAGIIEFGFSGTANPAYHQPLTSSIGPLIYILQISGFGGNLDCVSQKAFNAVSGIAAGFPAGITINYKLVNDNQGRLTSQSASFGGASVLSYRYY
jgi:hypothetical protein